MESFTVVDVMGSTEPEKIYIDVIQSSETYIVVALEKGTQFFFLHRGQKYSDDPRWVFPTRGRHKTCGPLISSPVLFLDD